MFCFFSSNMSEIFTNIPVSSTSPNSVVYRCSENFHRRRKAHVCVHERRDVESVFTHIVVQDSVVFFEACAVED